MIELSPYLVTVIVGCVSSVVTAIFTYLAMRKKNNTDSFKALIDANETFRNEIRKDLETVKCEKDEYKKLVESLQKKISDYEIQIAALRVEIAQYKDDILEYQKQITSLKIELGKKIDQPSDET